MANTKLLHRTLEYIKANPESWDQCRWTMCFAGITLRLAGEAELSTDECSCCGDLLTPDGVVLGPDVIEASAQRLLGLGTVPTVALFQSWNTLDDLERIVRELTEAEPAGNA
jgi:hypothetical protein